MRAGIADEDGNIGGGVVVTAGAGRVIVFGLRGHHDVPAFSKVDGVGLVVESGHGVTVQAARSCRENE